jgi:hypothetical protein
MATKAQQKWVLARHGHGAGWRWQAALGLGALVLGLGAWRGSAGTAMR